MSDKEVKHFYEVTPTVENYWRAIILFGRNSASYKFALAKSLFDLRQSGGLIKLEDLAPVFARHIVEHLSHSDRQGTNPRSAFLDACRSFLQGEVGETELVDVTLRRGFVNVIDAFHNVHGDELPTRFFVDERGDRNGIRLTDAFYELAVMPLFVDLQEETESRWRLVETAWNLRMPNAVLNIDYDQVHEELVAVPDSMRRQAVTKARTALNGYQKGHCFYCFRRLGGGSGSGGLGSTDHGSSHARADYDSPNARADYGSPNARTDYGGDSFDGVDVDHFFPHKLRYCADGKAIDGVSNLVLACQECNRGEGGKFDRLPSLDLLERLHQRNEYLISSHHPLRETLIRQTGLTSKHRIKTLQDVYNCSTVTLASEKWKPAACGDAVF